MKLSRRSFLRLAGLGGAAWALGLPALRQTAPGRLRLGAIGWRPVDADLASVGRTAGVNLMVADAGADLAGLDLAVVPAHAMPGLLAGGRLQPLPNLPAQPEAGQRPYDPQAAFTRLAGRGAVGINARNGRAPAAWADFFDRAHSIPAYLPAAEAFGAALISLGSSINTRDYGARARAAQLLTRLNASPLEEAELALGAPIPGWSYVVPTEGAELWEACWCLPAGSARPAEASAFIRAAMGLGLPAVPAGRLEPRSAFGLPIPA